MAYHTKIPIVTNGLVFSVDAYNRKSYVSGSTTVNDLASSNTGTLTNGVGFDGFMWDFDGVNDYINFGLILTNYVQLNKSFSVDCWVKANSFSGTFGRYVYGNRRANEGGTHGGVSLRFLTSGELRFVFYQGGGTTGEWVTTDNSYSLNTWYHITTTYDGLGSASGLKMYINGVLVNQTITLAATPTNNSTTPITVGKSDQTGTNDSWNGNIPDFKVYNRAISSIEVLQNYNALKWRFL